jgi:D-arginine dehydrogenase
VNDPVVDVAIIGGGIAGLSAAWALTRAGATVRLVEREGQLGHHATGRSAALLNETVGAAALRPLVVASRDFLEAPPSGFAEQPLSGPRGLLWIAGPGQATALDELKAEIAPTTARRIDAEAVRELVPRLQPAWAAAGGVHEPGARRVDVDALLQAYARGARAGGAGVQPGLEALRLSHRPGCWQVETPAGAFRAGTVVDAAGAWGDEVARRAGVRPLGLVALRRTACLVPAPAAVAGWPLVMDVGGSFYAEPDVGGLLLSPADETPSEPCDARPEELDVALALDHLNAATDLDVRHVRSAWAGLRTFAPDRVPVAGRDPDAPGFCWLVGQGGGGIKTAPALAALIAAEITGEDPDGIAAHLDAATRAVLMPGRLR